MAVYLKPNLSMGFSIYHKIYKPTTLKPLLNLHFPQPSQCFTVAVSVCICVYKCRAAVSVCMCVFTLFLAAVSMCMCVFTLFTLQWVCVYHYVCICWVLTLLPLRYTYFLRRSRSCWPRPSWHGPTPPPVTIYRGQDLHVLS